VTSATHSAHPKAENLQTLTISRAAQPVFAQRASLTMPKPGSKGATGGKGPPRPRCVQKSCRALQKRSSLPFQNYRKRLCRLWRPQIVQCPAPHKKMDTLPLLNFLNTFFKDNKHTHSSSSKEGCPEKLTVLRAIPNTRQHNLQQAKLLHMCFL